MKLKLILIAVVLFNVNLIFAQFPGKRSKESFMAIDSVSYKVGDTITFGQPTKGDVYASILMYKHKTFMDNLDDTVSVLNGIDIKGGKIESASKKIKEKKDAKIKYFKTVTYKSGKKVLYAIVPYDNSIYLAIPIDASLYFGEIKSKNTNFLPISKTETKTIDDTYVKSFSSDFKVKLLSAKGDKNNQTVKIEFLISHKLVHQQVSFYFGKDNAKMYDFEGNEYLAKSASIGAVNKNISGLSGLGYLSNKVPTNVPVKATIVFKQILPDKNKMSFVTIKAGHRASDSESYKYEYGTLELTNIKIDWK